MAYSSRHYLIAACIASMTFASAIFVSSAAIDNLTWLTSPTASTIEWTLGSALLVAGAFVLLGRIFDLPWKPDHRASLALDRISRQAADVAYAPRASAFRSFIERVKSHAERLGDGFVPETYKARHAC